MTHLTHSLTTECEFIFKTLLYSVSDTKPLCKSPECREKAHAILAILARQHHSARMILCDLTSELIRQLSTPMNGWDYLPVDEERVHGHVGLVNQGATCYMNSVIQQLFMVPLFRRDILQIDRDPEDQDLLYQLQIMFGFLLKSRQRAYDTMPFCKSYKGIDGQSMNVYQQMDADEFFSVLLDRLEMALKGRVEEKMFQRHFGGEILQEIKSNECPHVSQRHDSFFVIPVEVKNKKNLLESLELFVQGEMLVGDNKYACGTCGTKVDALKR